MNERAGGFYPIAAGFLVFWFMMGCLLGCCCMRCCCGRKKGNKVGEDV